MAINQTQNLTKKKIVICGAGIGGLAFAIALRKLWPRTNCSVDDFPTVAIYEREELDQSNREGYSMSIRSDTEAGGMQALQKLGILDDVLAVSITGTDSKSGSFFLWDRNFHPFLTIKPKANPGLPAQGMRIARKNLRGKLMEMVDKNDKIHWGVKCERAEVLEGGRVGLYFENGRSEVCDLLIVADGANSKIRSALRPDDKLSFAGVVSINAMSTFPDGNLPAPVDHNWGMAVGGDGVGLFVSPVDKTTALWSVSYRAPVPRSTSKQPREYQSNKELLQEALDRAKNFAEPFQTLARATNMSTLSIYNAMDKKPFSHTPVDAFGHTVFIGDANHAVSPFAGNGANMALSDAWDLAQQLCSQDSVEDAIRQYDKDAVPRANATLRFSHFSIALAHSNGLMFWIYSILLRLMSLLF